VYVSDFGKERLAREDVQGPILNGVTETIEDLDNLDKKTKEAIRAYQMERLRYYYAIAECDSIATAEAIYSACDGIEYETSGVRMDMRFVPVGMQFEDVQVKEKVTPESINLDRYRPKVFENEALAKSTTKFRWDETDPDRIEATRAAFDPKADLDETKLRDLVAPGSSSDDEDDEIEEEEDEQREEMTKADKMKSLLDAAGIDGKSPWSKSEQPEMSITWQPDDIESETIKPQPKDSQKKPKITPWDEYLEKRKQKRRERKSQIADLKRKAREDQNDEDGEAASTSKLKTKKQKKTVNLEQVDLDDARFSARLTNPEFHLEPANVRFREGQAQKMVSTRQAIREAEAVADQPAGLVAKLKRKTEKLKKAK